ncbi:DUF1565 domain-containing protein, partial [Bosea sp. 2YAB26]|uniref:DUF1565 domain-containing protein n=1 Tax=Bosea sp. 2YAB26 TaxID=3237478 RepID=UPI003F907A05
ALGQLAANRGYNASDADLTALIQSLSGALGPAQTLSDITYYVNAASGNDSNNGLTSSAPFKTISKAISMIPQIVNHNVIINVAAGTYNEEVSLSGYMGNGYVGLQGSSVIVKSVSFSRCNRLVISGFTATTTTTTAFSISDITGFVDISNCIVTAAAPFAGFYAIHSRLAISGCTVSNRSDGILAVAGSQISSNTNSGTGNGSG